MRHVGGSALPVSLEGMVRKEGRMSQKKKQLTCQRPNPPSPSPFLHSLPPSPRDAPLPRPRHPPPSRGRLGGRERGGQGVGAGVRRGGGGGGERAVRRERCGTQHVCAALRASRHGLRALCDEGTEPHYPEIRAE